jgi:hypothetical protein
MMFLGGCGREQAASVAKTAPVTPGAGSAPQVSSVNPANLFDCEPINRKITTAFSKAMDFLTITTATFLVTGISPVTGTVVWDATNNIALFKPSSNLAPDAIYTATITTSAKDTTGNPLASNFSWSFESCLTTDTTAPTVNSTIPVNTATAVPINGKIIATFSEGMDSTTLTATRVREQQGFDRYANHGHVALAALKRSNHGELLHQIRSSRRTSRRGKKSTPSFRRAERILPRVEG